MFLDRIYCFIQFSRKPKSSVTINSVNGETKRVTDFIVNASLIFKSITVSFYLFLCLWQTSKLLDYYF